MQTDTMIYSGSITKLLFALLHSSSIQLESYFTNQQDPFQRRKPYTNVASVRKIIDDKSLSDVDSKTRWIKYVPIKVNVHAWKVKTDSLPTRFNVSRRCIDIDSIMCAICDNGVETSKHLFFYCCMVIQIVRKITRWWDVPYVE
ncbi:RNA-directed DNA polymerase, eukaryota, partial [Tanacetum coccineum]